MERYKKERKCKGTIKFETAGKSELTNQQIIKFYGTKHSGKEE